MNQEPDSPYFGKKIRIFIWIILGVFGIPFFGATLQVYDTFFYTPPDFDNLNIKSGILTKAGECQNRYNPAAITINGKNEFISLPCGQHVSALSEEIGQIIEIRYDPNYLSFFSSNPKIWHISTQKKAYYDYQIANAKFNKQKKNNQYTSYILILFTIIFILINFKTIKDIFSKSEIPNSMDAANMKNVITFEPSNIYLGIVFYISSILTIWLICLGIFVYPIFLFVAIFTAPFIVQSHNRVRKNKYDITLSPNGIKYELIKELIPADTIKWSEIEAISTDPRIHNSWEGELIIIKLADRNRTSLNSKKEDSTVAFKFVPLYFKNHDYLREMLFRMYGTYRNKYIGNG